MSTTKQRFRWQAHKPLLAATLALAGAFNLVSVVLAEGTPAGTLITNTATATYDDGVGPNPTPINATSNTVTINVAEVAGLVAVPNGFLDVNGDAIEGTDTLVYSFIVTNTGNDETDVFIPGTEDILTTNFNVAAADGGKVEIFTPDGQTLLGTVPPGGGNYSTILLAGPTGTSANVLADGKFVVKVTGKISQFRTTGPANVPVDSGDLITVTLGNVAPNDNSAATQNQILVNNAKTDLKTVNVGLISPANEREASATTSVPFGGSNKPLALATVLKTSAVRANSSSSTQDDQITYTLGLRVESNVPAGNNFQAAPLKGTNIQLNSGSGVTTQNRILVSDVIPEKTVFQTVSSSIPGGWTPVYSITPAANSNPLAVTWTTTRPSDLSTITRVGFIHNGPLGAGFSTTGLSFTVVTSGLGETTGGTISNLAQVFGETVGGNGNIIYDESGDQNPNNFDGNTAPDPSGSSYSPGTDDGVARAAYGIDINNDNRGDGPKGEINQVTIRTFSGGIFNGPDQQPTAAGPNSFNDDFTNKSTSVPPGIVQPVTGGVPVASNFDPAPVTFKNTLKNPAAVGFLSSVTLQPIAPQGTFSAESADGSVNSGRYGVNTDIPDGTVVTITRNTSKASYSYTATGGFVFAPDPATGTPTTAHVNVGEVSFGETVDYTVTVDLPSGQALKAVSIPIIAFPETGTPGYSGETINNITIDRLYTGFMSLQKSARVLRADRTERIPFSRSFNTATQNILPGEYIEYKIDYVNISESSSGSGNVTLAANNFVITEDGTTGGNTWALNNRTVHQQNTVFKAGTTMQFIDLTGSTATSDPVDGTKVDSYVNMVGTVLPGPANGGSLIFRRRVN